MFCSAEKHTNFLHVRNPHSRSLESGRRGWREDPNLSPTCLNSQCLVRCLLEFLTGNCVPLCWKFWHRTKEKKSIKHTINFLFCGKTVLPAFLIVQVRVIRGKNGLNAIILMIKTYITLSRGSYLLVILNIVTETLFCLKKSNSYGIDGENF